MELTGAHKNVLTAIGQSGKTDDGLGTLLQSDEFSELVTGGYIRGDQIEFRETTAPGVPPQDDVRVWYLTAAGATAIGIDPARIGLA